MLTISTFLEKKVRKGHQLLTPFTRISKFFLATIGTGGCKWTIKFRNKNEKKSIKSRRESLIQTLWSRWPVRITLALWYFTQRTDRNQPTEFQKLSLHELTNTAPKKEFFSDKENELSVRYASFPMEKCFKTDFCFEFFSFFYYF